jgi:hypothetical protein
LVSCQLQEVKGGLNRNGKKGKKRKKEKDEATSLTGSEGP